MLNFPHRLAALTPLTILIIIIALRALFLGYSDLVDPTESRYASVAQQMVLDNDWVTPKLPQPEGVVPYLGKPPLHFWLTALSYELLGFSNFSSRLPSLIASIAILMLVISFARRYFDFEIAEIAALITFSCALVFFLAGASVIDVTLSACFCATIISFASYLARPSQRLALILGACLALGFLTKGPVIIALFFFTAIPFLLLRRELHQLKSFHWGCLFLSFFIVATPWFILSEIANPGFLKYFFWNENLARYLVRDYGDLYGEGHVYPRGTSWLMLFQAFMPWSLVFFFGLLTKDARNELLLSIKNDKWLLLCLCWGLSPAIFFTFGRQLHVSYLLPGIPGLALFLAHWSKTYWNSTQRILLIKILSRLSATLGLGIILVATTYEIPWQLILVVSFAYFLFFATYYLSSAKHTLQTLPHSILQLSFVFLGILILSTPIVNIRKSSNSILEKILAQTKEKNLRIGVVTQNNYSPYWLSNKWASEGRSNLKIEFISDSPNQKDLPKTLILKKGSEVNLAPQIFAKYELKAAVDRWRWYQIK